VCIHMLCMSECRQLGPINRGEDADDPCANWSLIKSVRPSHEASLGMRQGNRIRIFDFARHDEIRRRRSITIVCKSWRTHARGRSHHLGEDKILDGKHRLFYTNGPFYTLSRRSCTATASSLCITYM
jgi:hypothetical protein